MPKPDSSQTSHWQGQQAFGTTAPSFTPPSVPQSRCSRLHHHLQTNVSTMLFLLRFLKAARDPSHSPVPAHLKATPPNHSFVSSSLDLASAPQCWATMLWAAFLPVWTQLEHKRSNQGMHPQAVVRSSLSAPEEERRCSPRTALRVRDRPGSHLLQHALGQARWPRALSSLGSLGKLKEDAKGLWSTCGPAGVPASLTIGACFLLFDLWLQHYSLKSVFFEKLSIITTS